MHIYHTRHNIWFRAIATLVACLFYVNTISWAMPEIRTLAQKTALQVPSMFDMTFHEYDREQMKREFVFIAAMALKALGEDKDSFEFHSKLNINSAIDKAYADIRDARKDRILKVVKNPIREGDNIIVEFKVRHGPQEGKSFRIPINYRHIEDIFDSRKIKLEEIPSDKAAQPLDEKPIIEKPPIMERDEVRAIYGEHAEVALEAMAILIQEGREAYEGEAARGLSPFMVKRFVLEELPEKQGDEAAETVEAIIEIADAGFVEKLEQHGIPRGEAAEFFLLYIPRKHGKNALQAAERAEKAVIEAASTPAMWGLVKKIKKPKARRNHAIRFILLKLPEEYGPDAYEVAKTAVSIIRKGASVWGVEISMLHHLPDRWGKDASKVVEQVASISRSRLISRLVRSGVSEGIAMGFLLGIFPYRYGLNSYQAAEAVVRFFESGVLSAPISYELAETIFVKLPKEFSDLEPALERLRQEFADERQTNPQMRKKNPLFVFQRADNVPRKAAGYVKKTIKDITGAKPVDLESVEVEYVRCEWLDTVSLEELTTDMQGRKIYWEDPPEKELVKWLSKRVQKPQAHFWRMAKRERRKEYHRIQQQDAKRAMVENKPQQTYRIRFKTKEGEIKEIDAVLFTTEINIEEARKRFSVLRRLNKLDPAMAAKPIRLKWIPEGKAGFAGFMVTEPLTGHAIGRIRRARLSTGELHELEKKAVAKYVNYWDLLRKRRLIVKDEIPFPCSWEIIFPRTKEGYGDPIIVNVSEEMPLPDSAELIRLLNRRPYFVAEVIFDGILEALGREEGMKILKEASSNLFLPDHLQKELNEYLAWEPSTGLGGWQPISVEKKALSAKELRESLSNLPEGSWYSRTAVIDLGNGYVQAVKFLKKGEKEAILKHEAVTMRELNGEGIDLPIPVKMGGKYTFTYKGALPHAPPEVNLSRKAITYIVKKEYFTYPEDIETVEEMKLCAARSLAQLARMFKAGYIHKSLSSLTHGASEWCWILKPVGTIHSLKENASHSNMRLIGLADFAHASKIKSTDYLYLETGKVLFEWAAIITYHSLQNNFSEEDILEILKTNFKAFLEEVGGDSNIDGELNKLKEFIALLKEDTKRNRMSAQGFGDRPTVNYLISFIETMMNKIEDSSIYKDMWPLQVEDIAEWEVHRPAAMVKHENILYVADEVTRCITKIDLKDGSYEDIAKGSVITPADMLKEGSILYVADRGKECIVKINLEDNSYEDIAEESEIIPNGIVKEGNTLLVCDINKHRIVKINLENNSYEDIAKESVVNPTAIVKEGNIAYVAKRRKNCIVKIDLENNSYEEIAKGSVSDPTAMLKEGNALYVADINKRCIVKINLEDNSYEDIAEWSILAPSALVKEGNILYIADLAKRCVVKLTIPRRKRRLKPATPKDETSVPSTGLGGWQPISMYIALQDGKKLVAKISDIDSDSFASRKKFSFYKGRKKVGHIVVNIDKKENFADFEHLNVNKRYRHKKAGYSYVMLDTVFKYIIEEYGYTAMKMKDVFNPLAAKIYLKYGFKPKEDKDIVLVEREEFADRKVKVYFYNEETKQRFKSMQQKGPRAEDLKILKIVDSEKEINNGEKAAIATDYELQDIVKLKEMLDRSRTRLPFEVTDEILKNEAERAIELFKEAIKIDPGTKEIIIDELINYVLSKEIWDIDRSQVNKGLAVLEELGIDKPERRRTRKREKMELSSEENAIRVRMREVKVTNPKTKRWIYTKGLASCIALVIWDEKTKTGTMGHFANTAESTLQEIEKGLKEIIQKLHRENVEFGRNLKASIVGGIINCSEGLYLKLRRQLDKHDIEIVEEDILGVEILGEEVIIREIALDTATGILYDLEGSRPLHLDKDAVECTLEYEMHLRPTTRIELYSSRIFEGLGIKLFFEKKGIKELMPIIKDDELIGSSLNLIEEGKRVRIHATGGSKEARIRVLDFLKEVFTAEFDYDFRMRSLEERSERRKEWDERCLNLIDSLKPAPSTGRGEWQPIPATSDFRLIDDFGLSSDEIRFRNDVRAFAEKLLPDDVVEEIDRTNEFPKEIIKEIAEAGYIEAAHGPDTVKWAIIMKEFARRSASVALILDVVVLATHGIKGYGTEKQKEEYSYPTLRGEKIGAFCLTEAGAGSDNRAMITKAIYDEDTNEYVFNGQKTFITLGTEADYLVVYAKTRPKDRGSITAFIVPRDAEGVTVKKLNMLGVHGTETAEITFEDVRVPEESRLGEEGQGLEIALSTLREGRIAIASMGWGMLEAALEDSTTVLAEVTSETGVTPETSEDELALIKMGKFQKAVVDMRADSLIARMLVLDVARRKDAGKEIDLVAPMAKLKSSEAAREASAKAVEIMGPLGYRQGNPAEIRLRDAKLLTIGEGTSQIMELLIARELRIAKGGPEAYTRPEGKEFDRSSYDRLFADKLDSVTDTTPAIREEMFDLIKSYLGPGLPYERLNLSKTIKKLIDLQGERLVLEEHARKDKPSEPSRRIGPPLERLESATEAVSNHLGDDNSGMREGMDPRLLSPSEIAESVKGVVREEFLQPGVVNNYSLNVMRAIEEYSKEMDEVDIVIDLSLIPEKSLEESMEVWAGLILSCVELKNVNFMFEIPAVAKKGELPEALQNHLNNAAEYTKAMEVLEEKIRRNSAAFDLGDVKDLIENRINVGRRDNAVEILIVSKGWLEWMEELRRLETAGAKDIGLEPNQYPVALEGSGIWNARAAVAIGLAKAVLVMAKRRDTENKDREGKELKAKIKVLYPRLKRLYKVFGKDEGVTEETLENMVDPSPVVKIPLAIDLALPPITRMAIDDKLWDHDHIQLFLQYV